MRKLSSCSALIFDMDGLVLDTESTYLVAWQQAAEAMGFMLPEAFCRSLSGMHYQDVAQRLLALCGADFNLPTFYDLSAMFWRKYVYTRGIDIKHGFAELLDFIIGQRIPYCLATNSPATITYECLELAGIKDAFSHIVTRDDVGHGKPEPDIFLKAADLMQVSISHCLVLEDSPPGIIAAVRAGAFAIFVPSTDSDDSMVADLYDLKMMDLAQTLVALKQAMKA